MLSFRTTVSLLWLIALVHISKAGKIRIPEEISENPVGLKTDFARHAMEISDLLRMFISLIKKADEEEGREFGLPEITTTVPINLETASIEELFDRFETAAQSFRTRFLKYLKSKEPPGYSVTPTMSTVVELHTEEDSSKYVYEHEDEVKVDNVPDSEIKTVYSTSTIHPETENTLIKRTSLAFILPTESSEIEIETDSSTSTEVSDGENSNFPSDESPSAFIVTNDEIADSDYSASTIVAQASDSDLSRDGATLAFLLSNEEQSQETKESLPIDEETSDEDIILTLVPVRRQNSKSLDELSFESFSEFDTPASQFDPKVALNHEDVTSNGKSQSIPATVKTINGDATLVLESNEDANGKVLFSATDYPVEITLTPFTPTEESSEEYTFVPLSTTEDYSDKGFKKIFSTTGNSDDEVNKIILADDLGEIANEVLSAMKDSDEDDGEVLSTTADASLESSRALSTAADSEEDSGALQTTDDSEENWALSTTDDSEEEIGALSTTDDSEEESGDLSTTDDSEEDSEGLSNTDDSDEDGEGLSNTDDSDDEDGEVFSTVDDSGKKTSDIRSTIEEKDLDELVKMLQKISERYSTKQSEKRTKNENVKSRKDLSDSRRLIQNSKILSLSTTKIPKVIEPLVEYMPSSNNAELVDKQIFPNFKKSSEMDKSENFSDRIGLTYGSPVYSHLDVIGEPGENYPNYTHIPATSFTCEGKEKPGFYGDLETRCQVFHVCWPHRIESYLCPVGSTFHQQKLSCDYWFQSTCSLSPDHYDVNLRLRNYPPQDDWYYAEDTDIHPYNYKLHLSHPVFNRMKFLPFMYKITNSASGRGIESGREIDYNETMQIEFDQDSTLPPLEDLQQETTTDMIDSVKDRFRELLKSFVESEASKNAESSEDDSLLGEKLQERKFVYEKMSVPKLGRSGMLPEEESEEESEAEVTPPKLEEDNAVLLKNVKSKNGKEQIAPAIVFKVLETAENVVTKGILPMTRDLLVANYIKLYKKKKL